MLQFVDHQAIAVPAHTLQGNGRARHIAAQALQLAPVARSASDRRIEREAVTRGGERLRLLRALAGGSRGVQAKRLASCDGAHGDAVADGRALELRERILAIAVQVEPELFLVVILLCDQRAVRAVQGRTNAAGGRMPRATSVRVIRRTSVSRRRSSSSAAGDATRWKRGRSPSKV